MESGKDSYEMLSVSESASDSPLYAPEILVRTSESGRRKRLKKRPTRQNKLDCSDDEKHGSSISTGFGLLLAILICWMTVLTFVIVLVNSDVREMSANVETEDYSKCQSLYSVLQSNQSDLHFKLTHLSNQMNGFAKQISSLSIGLRSVQQKLRLRKIKDDGDDVTDTFENEIKDIRVAINLLNESEARLVDKFEKNFTMLRSIVNSLSGRNETYRYSHDRDHEQIMKSLENVTSYVNQVDAAFNRSVEKVETLQHLDHQLILMLQNTTDEMLIQIDDIRYEMKEQKVEMQTTSEALLRITQQLAADEKTWPIKQIDRKGLPNDYDGLPTSSVVKKSSASDLSLPSSPTISSDHPM